MLRFYMGTSLQEDEKTECFDSFGGDLSFLKQHHHENDEWNQK